VHHLATTYATVLGRTPDVTLTAVTALRDLLGGCGDNIGILAAMPPERFSTTLLAKAPTALRDFLLLLHRKRRLELAVAACDKFIEDRGILDVQLHVGGKLDSETVREIGAAVAEKIGREVKVKTVIDSSISGGFRVTACGFAIDATLDAIVRKAASCAKYVLAR
jgi:hypothetical protein